MLAKGFASILGSAYMFVVTRAVSRGPGARFADGFVHGPDGATRHPSLGTALRCLLFVMYGILGLGCDAAPVAPPSTAPEAPDVRAARVLALAAGLPTRAELVALADEVAVEAARGARPAETARLYAEAAALRLRAFRHDAAEADGREALELLTSAAKNAPSAEEACGYALQRALIAGEVAHEAALTHRELYLASRVQGARNPSSPCAQQLERLLAASSAYRPSGDALRRLESDAERAVRGAAPPAASAVVSPPPVASVSAEAAPQGEVVVSLDPASASKDPVKILGIDPYPGEDAARVVVRLSGPATYEVGALAADAPASASPRLFVDIRRATAKGIGKELAVGGPVHRVRVGAQKDATRIVLDLRSAGLRRRVFFLPDPFRIVIDVAVPREPNARAVGSPSVLRRVAIDPGHGGTDDGAVGPTGLKEKDVTLDIAHRVAPLLAHELHVEALLTRDTDVYVPLEARTARANAFHADLFVSIHANASEDGLARGLSTFVLDGSATESSAALEARENFVRGTLPGAIDAAAMFRALSPGELGVRSRHFAELLQRATLASAAERYPDTKDLGVRNARFFVLVGTDMPAVLMETAFVSNPDDEARLATADYRQKLADGIVNAIRAYRDGR